MKKNKLWFRRKTYGWGWTPITWEGWLVTFIVLIIPLCIRLTAKAMDVEKSTQYFYTWASVPMLLMVLVLICFRYGEKPKWQWGIKRTKLAHLDLVVSNYKESVRFYDLVLLSLGWEKLVSRLEYTSYTDGTLKIQVMPAQGVEEFKSPKRLVLYAETKEVVDDFYREVMLKNNMISCSGTGAVGDKNYYSIQLKGPDQIIVEILYSPFYCDKEFILNNLEQNFNAYV